MAQESVREDVADTGNGELDRITRRFRRVLYLINVLIVVMVLHILGRAISPKLAKATEKISATLMTGALVILAAVHGYSLRKTRVEDVERIRFLTMHDGLTQVYNVRHLNERIDQEIDRSKRFGHPFCLIFIDLDDFKRVNDTYGHEAGDKVLIAVAAVLRDTCRVTDMVGRLPGVVGRIGGDEFLVLMPETGIPEARQLPLRLIRAIRKLRIDLAGRGQVDFVGASFGIACYPQDAEERKALLEKADAAMYRAKEAGGNRLSDSSGKVFDPLAEGQDSEST